MTGINLEVVSGYIISSGSTTGTYTQGDSVSIKANPPSEGWVFTNWSLSGGGSVYGGETATVYIGTTDTTVSANYRALEYHKLTVHYYNETVETYVEKYASFSINANAHAMEYNTTFDHWYGDTSGLNTTEASTGTTMGNYDREIWAAYRSINLYTLTIQNRTYTGTVQGYELGTTTITADPAPTGMRFTGWSLSGKGRLTNSSAQTTTFTFGNGDATVTANYINRWTITVTNGGTIDGQTSIVADQGSSHWVNKNVTSYQRFLGWSKSGEGTFQNSASSGTYFTVGRTDATLTPSVEDYPDRTLTIYMADPTTGTTRFISSNTYRHSTRVTFEAPVAPDTYTFLAWEGSDTDLNLLENALSSTALFKAGGITKDVTYTATYFQPEAPARFALTVYNGSPQTGTYPEGQQVAIYADSAGQGYEFYKWYGDTSFLVQPRTTANNAVIIPHRSIVLSAKYNLIGELPLFQISVDGGTASGTYITGADTEHPITHNESGTEIFLPPGVTVTLVADPDTYDREFDHWSGNFEAAGIRDIDLTSRTTTFTMSDEDLNIYMIRREKAKYIVTVTDGNAIGEVPVGTYNLTGTKTNTDTIHYEFDHWTCEDLNGNDCITAIGDPTDETTTITVSDRSLNVVAHYNSFYKLTVVSGQDTGDGFYYEGEIVNTVYANTPPLGSGLIFDHWDDPIGVIDTTNSNIYDPTPRIIMGDVPATITAIYTNGEPNENSVILAGINTHSSTNNLIYRHNTSIISGIYAVGTIVFDNDGCIGIITEVNPDGNDNTDDYRSNRLFYGGNR